MNTTRPTRMTVLAAEIILLLLAAHLRAAAERPPTPPGRSAGAYCAVQVVDRQTGRGVPLVELRTTNNLRLLTDSNGFVAFLEPGLMDREVFFFVESHGYEVPKDGFGYRGVRLRTTPGTSAQVKIDRLNIAERLYRVTGQGICRDSVLLGRDVPLREPVLNGQVMGQDSVFTCLHRGRLFWMWGDTARPSYPLGNFAMSGAWSDLPGHGGLDPGVGVNLEYFVDENGFSRKMAPLKEPGLVWLDGLLTVLDPQGKERMVAKFARLKGLSEVLERGLMVFNDDTDTFEPLVRPGREFLCYRNTGHAFPVKVQGRPYYYFTTPSPVGARLRVPAEWNAVIDANQYEVLTALVPGDRTQKVRGSEDGKVSVEEDKTVRPSHLLNLSPSSSGPPCRWITFGDVLAAMGTGKTAVIEALEAEAKGVQVYDDKSGRAITPHNGTVYFNAHRQRWIAVFGQLHGESSALGEIWYAEADTPIGPWAYARKIVTHNKYSFYNPKHHPLFDQDGGRTIYFEGTYTWTFSGSEERATPRYDYNQIMYRLNLDDPRLVLPAPVYELQDGQGGRTYSMRDAVARADRWDSVASVGFYAVEPNRTADGLVG
ncbi:MAG: hypothetical protein MUC88_20555, partial [Planctomycetes bacterium]|nr:hypothetical protein [Planctomycetota bacterium]